MKIYLHLRCGTCELLLDAALVEAVDFIANAERDSSGRRLWREQVLPVLDLTATLGLSGSSRQQMVVNVSGQRCIVEVEEVLDLRPVEPADWQGFAVISARSAHFFDAALPLSDGRCLLRLRQPLPWMQC